MSRVLPYGGPTTNANKVAPLSLQSVDRPNANSKFSRVQPPKSNLSTVFSANGNAATDSVTPRTGKRVLSGAQPVTPEVSPRATLRITQFDKEQAAAARYREDHPRALRRHASAEPSRENSVERPVTISGNGIAFVGGKKVDDRKYAETTDRPQPRKDYESMERFKASTRVQAADKNVLHPETLPTHVPPFKEQRFRSSPSTRHTSLVGVLVADPSVRAPPPYKPRAPFHTDE